MSKELGHAARTLCEAAAVAYGARDGAQAVILLKALARGSRLVDLAPPAKHAEASALVAAITARAQTGFNEWARSHHAPASELAAALAHFEETATRQTERVARESGVAQSGPEALEAMFLASASSNPVFADDIVVRDIGWALFKAIMRAGRDYADALRSLGLSDV